MSEQTERLNPRMESRILEHMLHETGLLLDTVQTYLVIYDTDRESTIPPAMREAIFTELLRSASRLVSVSSWLSGTLYGKAEALSVVKSTTDDESFATLPGAIRLVSEGSCRLYERAQRLVHFMSGSATALAPQAQGKSGAQPTAMIHQLHGTVVAKLSP